MKVNCLVSKDFNVNNFIEWLKTQKVTDTNYYQLVDTYITSIYPEVLCIDEWDKDELIIFIQDALNSRL